MISFAIELSTTFSSSVFLAFVSRYTSRPVGPGWPGSERESNTSVSGPGGPGSPGSPGSPGRPDSAGCPGEGYLQSVIFEYIHTVMHIVF